MLVINKALVKVLYKKEAMMLDTAKCHGVGRKPTAFSEVNNLE